MFTREGTSVAVSADGTSLEVIKFKGRLVQRPILGALGGTIVGCCFWGGSTTEYFLAARGYDRPEVWVADLKQLKSWCLYAVPRPQESFIDATDMACSNSGRTIALGLSVCRTCLSYVHILSFDGVGTGDLLSTITVPVNAAGPARPLASFQLLSSIALCDDITGAVKGIMFHAIVICFLNDCLVVVHKVSSSAVYVVGHETSEEFLVVADPVCLGLLVDAKRAQEGWQVSSVVSLPGDNGVLVLQKSTKFISKHMPIPWRIVHADLSMVNKPLFVTLSPALVTVDDDIHEAQDWRGRVRYETLNLNGVQQYHRGVFPGSKRKAPFGPSFLLYCPERGALAFFRRNRQGLGWFGCDIVDCNGLLAIDFSDARQSWMNACIRAHRFCSDF